MIHRFDLGKDMLGKTLMKYIVTMFFFLCVNNSFATTQVLWGGNASLTITQARYVNNYVYVNGQVHLPVNYNMASWCAKGTVGGKFKPTVALGWVSISKGSTVESWIQAPSGLRTRVYVAGCWGGERCVLDYNDYLWTGGKVYDAGGTWETVQCNNATSGGLVGVARSVPFGLILNPATRLTGGQVYTLTLNMNGGEVKSTTETELNSLLQSGSFVNDMWHTGGMRYNGVNATVTIPVEVTCTATAKNDVNWESLALTTAYFDRYKETGINVNCNGLANVTVTQKTANGVDVGFGLTSMLTNGTTRPGTWPLKRTVNSGTTSIPLFAHLYGTMNGAGKISGVHILNVEFD